MSTRAVVFAIAIAGASGCVDGPDDPDELGTATSSLDVTKFVLPPAAAEEREPIVRKYDLLDPGDEIPRGLLEDAVAYYDLNSALIPQTRYFVVVDFTRHSGMDRYWLVDTTDGSVEPHKVAHGDGSDPDNNGVATLFGNVEGSHKSSLGFYLTGEIYDGTHRHSMRLDGLSADGSPNAMANTNARERLIVMHEASYVKDTNTNQQGRSNGCLALDPSIEVEMVDRIHGGSLIYAATSALAAPVGRAACGDGICDGAETAATCAADCETDPPADDGTDDEDPGVDPAAGGCSAGGGAGLGFALALLGLRRRRRA